MDKPKEPIIISLATNQALEQAAILVIDSGLTLAQAEMEFDKAVIRKAVQMEQNHRKAVLRLGVCRNTIGLYLDHGVKKLLKNN